MCCIKLTTKHPEDETEFLERLLSVPQEKMVRVSFHFHNGEDNQSQIMKKIFANTEIMCTKMFLFQFSEHAVPFAWKSGHRFEILADCSEENLAVLIDAFNKEQLVTDEMLEILGIQS